MSYNADHDNTVLMPFGGANNSQREQPPFTPVAGNGLVNNSIMLNDVYMPQQTSLVQNIYGLNSLIDSASVLLLEMINIKNNNCSSDVSEYRNKLESDIKAFEVRALSKNIERAQILAARYVLCTALDESISLSSLGESGQWSKMALLSTFHNETWGGEKFFQVLDRCMQQPAKNLYLLELMYILISLGFEGRYRVMERGIIALEALRDKVYQQIRVLRGDAPIDLSSKIEPRKKENKIYTYVPTWMVVVFAAICFGISFGGFLFTLNKTSDRVLSEYDKIVQLDNAVKVENNNAVND